MSEQELYKLPEGWVWARIGDIAEINPKFVNNELNTDMEVSFIPMRAVGELNGRIDLSLTKRIHEVRKGYTPFRDGDILFAKITPCMENGKIAIVNNLKNGIGFGSTEFHVLRLGDMINKKLVFYFLLCDDYRRNAQRKMKGTAGQLRVPATFIENSFIPLPPLNEQKRIVAKLEELFSRLDAAVEALKKAREQLKRYRQSVLKSAFEGKLTEEWRKANKDKLEPASILLERIKEERRKDKKFKEMPPLDISGLPELPEGWIWARIGEIAEINPGFPSGKHNKKNIGVPHIRPMNININGEIDLSKIKYVEIDNYDRLKKGDVLFNNTNSPVLLGKTTYIKHDTNWAYSNHMTRLRFNTHLLNSAWVAYSLHTLFLKGFFRLNCTHHVNQASINSNFLAWRVLIPIPPLQEQNKIVEEIERLFSIAEKNEKIIEQSLKQADKLRQSILKQAFEGKLVPQDPSDEPASILLERIKEEKAKYEKRNIKRKRVIDNKQMRLI